MKKEIKVIELNPLERTSLLLEKKFHQKIMEIENTGTSSFKTSSFFWQRVRKLNWKLILN